MKYLHDFDQIRAQHLIDTCQVQYLGSAPLLKGGNVDHYNVSWGGFNTLAVGYDIEHDNVTYVLLQRPQLWSFN